MIRLLLWMLQNRTWRSGLLCLIFLPLTRLAQAQDANYWSGNFGAGGFFSPGAVVANNKDSGVLFYNPALQPLSGKNAISVSGMIYQVESINIKNGAGTGKNLHSLISASVPQMLTGTVKVGRRKPVFLAYALTHNAVINYNVTQQQDARMNVLNDSYSPGPEYYLGQYNLQNITRDASALISTGFRLDRHWAIGFMAEGQSRSQHYSENFLSRALVNSNQPTLPITSNEGKYQVDYTHFGFKLRAGLSYETGKHHLGLLLSSPLIHAWGRGRLLSDNAISNVHFIVDEPLNLLASTRQTKLDTRYKTPLSVAAGYAYDYSKGQFYVAAEYFLKVKEYTILAPTSDLFVRPDTGNSIIRASELLKMREARKAVFNVAVGVSYRIKPQLTGFCSLRTDFNYGERTYTDGTAPNTATWDNYYCQLGVNIKRSKYNLRTGLFLGYGRTGSYEQFINFDHPQENNLLTGERGMVPASRMTAAVMVAFIHNL
ncbi:hypothetical protein HF324_05930 [Chitinophaga oryzae]|uniref:Long-chain fatty acid transport protein n=1 Tax=Chitinophaga oryzae TaxID=2725414 RepID=A0ABX6LC87_9BACT|nr:hypothetical protein [Chitinophaga oryzae]QJB37415.1 hypothetical protein HF324_05930 [Chitinophaga oryzae]